MMSGMWQLSADSSVFFFNDTATTEIYTLSLHDALPISAVILAGAAGAWVGDNASYVTGRRLGRPLTRRFFKRPRAQRRDRKSTRLNSSHANISYAVFCLKKKTIPAMSSFDCCPDLLLHL